MSISTLSPTYEIHWSCIVFAPVECEAAMASPKTTSTRRPKLMRASATCPQLATSNASRKDLASLHSCGATTILTRVASYSSAQHEHAMRTSPLSSCSSPGQITEERRKEPFEIAISQCESLSLVFKPTRKGPNGLVDRKSVV